MRVLVTGGTGFVGSHAVDAIHRAGHDVRLLVRRPEQVPVSLGPHGIEVADLVVGDVRDREAVSAAIRGCDAVVHAAAVFSLDPSRYDEIEQTNVRATETVLHTAADARLDPIVHVSSTVALARFGGSGPDLPLGDVDLPYAQSKRRSEEVSRQLQEAGAPIVSVYPGGVYGPIDPYLSDNNRRLLWVMRGLFPIWPKGGLHVVDVRDVAAVIAAALEPGRGPRRYVVPGHHMDATMMYGTLRKVTGARYPYLIPPTPIITATCALLGPLNARVPKKWYYPAEREGVEITMRDTRFDATPTTEDLGVCARPLAETFADTAGWFVDIGLLNRRLDPRRRAAAV